MIISLYEISLRKFNISYPMTSLSPFVTFTFEELYIGNVFLNHAGFRGCSYAKLSLFTNTGVIRDGHLVSFALDT